MTPRDTTPTKCANCGHVEDYHDGYGGQCRGLGTNAFCRCRNFAPSDTQAAETNAEIVERARAISEGDPRAFDGMDFGPSDHSDELRAIMERVQYWRKAWREERARKVSSETAMIKVAAERDRLKSKLSGKTQYCEGCEKGARDTEAMRGVVEAANVLIDDRGTANDDEPDEFVTNYRNALEKLDAARSTANPEGK